MTPFLEKYLPFKEIDFIFLICKMTISGFPTVDLLYILYQRKSLTFS